MQFRRGPVALVEQTRPRRGRQGTATLEPANRLRVNAENATDLADPQGSLASPNGHMNLLTE